MLPRTELFRPKVVISILFRVLTYILQFKGVFSKSSRNHMEAVRGHFGFYGMNKCDKTISRLSRHKFSQKTDEQYCLMDK